MKLIVGLGNPGKKFAFTIHNAGFLLVEKLAETYSIVFKREENFNAFLGRGKIEEEKILIAKPLTYMNNSGIAVKALVTELKINLTDLIIVHDDVNLPLGILRIRVGGGDGGHKGIRSIIENLCNKEFIRLRLGVGFPALGESLTDYVLSEFSPDKFRIFQEEVKLGCEAIKVIVTQGVVIAMNKFNRKGVIMYA